MAKLRAIPNARETVQGWENGLQYFGRLKVHFCESKKKKKKNSYCEALEQLSSSCPASTSFYFW